jgi:hypothetical protein
VGRERDDGRMVKGRAQLNQIEGEGLALLQIDEERRRSVLATAF